MTVAVLSARDVQVSYGDAQAVRGVDLEIQPGETVALIGETGSGKTTLAHAVSRLLPPTARLSGCIDVGGVSVSDLTPAQLRERRGRFLGYVAQDAMSALNPTTRVGRQVAEALEVHGVARDEARARTFALLDRVRIQDPSHVSRLYPHELSGGMRQRIMIAMALALNPALVVADEPTTALDVSTQAEVLSLVDGLRRELGTSFLWITHDMGVVAEIADRVAVMYRGRIVESGPVLAIFDQPAHPYTAALLQTLRDLREGRPGSPMFQIDGQPPAIDSELDGCAFNPRCAGVQDRCRTEDPALMTVGDRTVRCHFSGLSASRSDERTSQ
jgi:oligopeptide/dipeptide ABC transporter ATP-binding protein